MEVKSEFLSAALDARNLFYANLPLPSLMLLRLASAQTNREIKNYLKASFGHTNRVVFDYIDETLQDPVVYTFFYDGRSLYVGKRDEECAVPDVFSKQWVLCNLAFQQFINDHYSQFEKYFFCLSEGVSKENQNSGTIYISIKDDKLKCVTVDKINSQLQIEIEADCFKDSSNPLTVEQIKPFQAKIRHELGLRSIRAFLSNLDMDTIRLFNNTNFRYFYLNKKIKYDTFCHGLLNSGYKSLATIKFLMRTIKDCAIELGDYTKSLYMTKKSVMPAQAGNHFWLGTEIR